MTTSRMPDENMIVAVFRKALELPDSFILDMQHTPAQVPGWDSVGWLNVIAEIEKTFALELDLARLEAVYNVRQLCDAVAESAAARQ